MAQSHSPAALTAVQRLCRMAVLAAVVFVMTMVPKIPIPQGYANLGEAAILLIALGFPRRDAALAAGLGSALTDLLGGYAVWAVPTFIIKGFMASVVTLTSGGRTFSDGGLSTGRILLSFLPASVWAVAGYTLAGAVLYGSLAVGLTSTPGLAVECAVNVCIAAAAGTVLHRRKAAK